MYNLAIDPVLDVTREPAPDLTRGSCSGSNNFYIYKDPIQIRIQHMKIIWVPNLLLLKAERSPDPFMALILIQSSIGTRIHRQKMSESGLIALEIIYGFSYQGVPG